MQSGCTSTTHAVRYGFQIEVAILETIEKVHEMTLAFENSEIMKALGIPHSSEVSILNSQLGIRKHSVKWVSLLLTIVINAFI